MKPHKHAELIKSWADGAEIEALFLNDARDNWTIVPNPAWSNVNLRFRIKPEPKPDVERHGSIRFDFIQQDWEEQSGFAKDNIKFIFDGETGELKSAEVLK